MNFPAKTNYWFKKYFIISILLLISIWGITYSFKEGHTYCAITLIFFVTSAAFVYQRLTQQNAILHNMAVLIIGCDSGLGYSLALHSRSLGFEVFASVLNKNGPNAKTMAQKGIHIHEVDITVEESVKNFVFVVRECLKKNNLDLYALVNNAGLMVIGDLEWQTDEQIRQQVEVNVTGTMRITKEMLPLLRIGKGRIIFISSHCTVQSLPGFGTYGGTKSAIRSWADSLRVELMSQGIKVVCFAPGSFFQQSKIMLRQMEYFKEMKDSMSAEVWNFYSKQFERVEKYLKTIIGYIEPQKMTDFLIYATFKDTLLDKYPSAFYECGPWRYTYYHTLCKIAPTCIRDKLIKQFVQIPR